MRDAGGDGPCRVTTAVQVYLEDVGGGEVKFRAHIGASGLIIHDSGTGSGSLRADNYTSWSFDTDPDKCN